MSNRNDDGNVGFGSLLYVKILIKKQYSAKDLAFKLGIAEDTFYRYCERKLTMPPDRIAKLIEITADMEFIDFFLSSAGLMAVKKAQGKIFDGPHEKDEILLSILNGQALEEIEKAHEDGRIDKQEFLKIQKRLVQLQQKAAEIQEKIRAEVKG